MDSTTESSPPATASVMASEPEPAPASAASQKGKEPAADASVDMLEAAGQESKFDMMAGMTSLLSRREISKLPTTRMSAWHGYEVCGALMAVTQHVNAASIRFFWTLPAAERESRHAAARAAVDAGKPELMQMITEAEMKASFGGLLALKAELIVEWSRRMYLAATTTAFGDARTLANLVPINRSNFSLIQLKGRARIDDFRDEAARFVKRNGGGATDSATAGDDSGPTLVEYVSFLVSSLLDTDEQRAALTQFLTDKWATCNGAACKRWRGIDLARLSKQLEMLFFQMGYRRWKPQQATDAVAAALEAMRWEAKFMIVLEAVQGCLHLMVPTVLPLFGEQKDMTKEQQQAVDYEARGHVLAFLDKTFGVGPELPPWDDEEEQEGVEVVAAATTTTDVAVSEMVVKEEKTKTAVDVTADTAAAAPAPVSISETMVKEEETKTAVDVTADTAAAAPAPVSEVKGDAAAAVDVQ